MKNLIVAVGIFFTLLSTGCKFTCSKKVTCAAYNGMFLEDWFPYKYNQQLIFKSNTNVLDTFLFNVVDSSLAYEFTSSTTRTYGCSSFKNFKAEIKDTPLPKLFINLNAEEISNNKSVSIYFKNRYFSIQDFRETGATNFTMPNGNAGNIKSFTNYSFNGSIYPIVQSIEADTTNDKNSGVYKILYAKKIGIIAYETNPSGIIWAKQ
jgi:hypothetical protein